MEKPFDSQHSVKCEANLKYETSIKKEANANNEAKPVYAEKSLSESKPVMDLSMNSTKNAKLTRIIKPSQHMQKTLYAILS